MHLLEQAAVFLLTAVLLVPLFQRLKLGAVLGYLGAGMLIGPFGFGMIGEVESTLQFAEFGVLLFQDVSVIPLLALLPLLSDSGTHAAGGWMAAVKGLAVIAVVIISSRIVVRPVLKAVASYGGREVFTAAALLLVVGAALIMEKNGLSPSLRAFILFVAAGSLGIFDAGTAQLLVVVVTVSMLLAPLAFEAHERGLARWTEQHATPEFDAITGPGNPVIIAGYGRVGQIISRVLRMCGVPFTALEVSYQQVDFVRRYGSKVYYGDASRLELLEAAKTGEARLFVLAIDDVEASVKTAAIVRKHFPQVPILARARNRVHLFRLRDLGVKLIWRETFPTSLDMARHALLSLGFGIAASERAVSLFKEHDEQRLEAQYAVQHDEAQLIQTSREAAAQLQELFESDGLQPLPGFPQPAAAVARKE